MEVELASNPSHLEFVDPVVEGSTRAAQTDHESPEGRHDPSVALAVLIHGDAAFPGEGVVAETLNLESLEGYSTGGTLHLIANNQLGFTTDPSEGRSTRYSSDLAKGFDIPIIHVNADDAEGAVHAIKLAMAYRAEFGHDIVVDLVGYRRFGHNEGDEPAYTQPLMYEKIETHPTVREQYAAALVEAGVLTQAEADGVVEEVQAEDEGRARAAARNARGGWRRSAEGAASRPVGSEQPETRIPRETLEVLNRSSSPSRRASPSTPSSRSSSSGGSRRWAMRAGSTGRRPRPSPSALLPSRVRPCG